MIRTKIQELQKKTSSDTVRKACEEALAKLNKNEAFVPVNEAEFESEVLNSLLESVQTVDTMNELSKEKSSGFSQDLIDARELLDEAARIAAEKKFEERAYSMKDMGVSAVFESLENCAIANYPAFSYAFQKLKASCAGQPDWKVVESVIFTLEPFSWDPTVKQSLYRLGENVDKLKEDLQVHRIVENLKNSRSSYLYVSIAESLEAYMKTRSSADRVSLMEKASQFIFDPHMKSLYNFLGESERSFHVQASDNSVSIHRIYSPISLSEACEYFVADNKVFKKFENTISEATQDEFEALPKSFKAVAEVLSWENITVLESAIKIYSGDKIVEIYEENGSAKIKVNGKPVNREDFHRVYMNSGVFRMSESNAINAVYAITENWNSIFEIDFAKTLRSKANPEKTATIFFLGENIFINKENRSLKESVLYSNCNAVQAKNLVMEHMKFDISESFRELLTKEEVELVRIKEQKEDYLQAIEHLTSRKSMLENTSADVRENEAVKSLIEAIVEEINALKQEFAELVSSENAFTKVEEGASAGDTAVVGKKK
jgi:hypothetical protein